jgi:hypothetical protein
VKKFRIKVYEQQLKIYEVEAENEEEVRELIMECDERVNLISAEFIQEEIESVEEV